MSWLVSASQLRGKTRATGRSHSFSTRKCLMSKHLKNWNCKQLLLDSLCTSYIMLLYTQRNCLNFALSFSFKKYLSVSRSNMIMAPFHSRQAVQHSSEGVAAQGFPQGEAICHHLSNTKYGPCCCELCQHWRESYSSLPHWLEGGKSNSAGAPDTLKRAHECGFSQSKNPSMSIWEHKNLIMKDPQLVSGR